MSNLLKPTNSNLPEKKELILKFTVEFGSAFELGDEQTLHAKLRNRANASKSFIADILNHLAEEAEALDKLNSDEAREHIQKMSKARLMQCAYYGHGSCPPDGCKVCCWVDDDPDPWCWCEAC